jgi:hypothetical protein
MSGLVAFAAAIFIGVITGFRIFLPLLIVGVAIRKDWLTVGSSLDFLGSWPALIVIAFFFAIETAIHYAPAADAAAGCVRMPFAAAVTLILELAMIPDTIHPVLYFSCLLLSAAVSITVSGSRIPLHAGKWLAGPLGALGVNSAEDVAVFVATVLLLVAWS